MTVTSGHDLLVRPSLLHAPQFIINYVIVERVLCTIRLLVLLLQFRSQLRFVNIFRRRFGCGGEAQRGINLNEC